MNELFSLSFPQNLFLPLFAISALVFTILNRANRVLKVKRVVLVFIGLGLLLSLGGLFAFSTDIYEGFYFFITWQIFAILVGMLEIRLFKKSYFDKFTYPEASEITFIILVSAFGFLGFSILFNLLSDTNLGYMYATANITAIVPYFFNVSLQKLLSIPTEIYTVWYVNEDREEPDFDKINVRNVYLLSLDILKDVNQKALSNIKVKAPIEMKFGDWFQSFLLNYNEKFAENPIQFSFLDGSSMGWVFHTKSSFWRSKRFIDAGKTITQNRLNEKVSIVASRVKISYQ